MGFLNPLALLFGGLIGVLVLLYLWERLRRRVAVPSLLLWQAVPEEAVQRQRFRPEWLFLLQLLLLVALILGLARPYTLGRSTGRSASYTIIILDTSASMQAREGKQTRFEQARQQAQKIIRDLAPGDQVMLITAAARPQIVSEFTPDHQRLLKLLDGLQPVDTGTELAPAIALAMRARELAPERTDIALLSDMPASAIDPQERALVQRYPVGETSDNLAISALQVFQGPFEDASEARAYVLVRNFSYAERHGVLSVSADDQVVTRTGFTIPGRGAQSFMARDFPGPGLLTASIDVHDALDVDNRAYGWLRPRHRIRMLLVSPASPLIGEIDHVARSVAGLSLEHISPEAYQPADAAAFDVVIFHRFAPPPPAAAALYIFPPARNSVFPVKEQAGRVEVMDWDAQHPILRDLRPLTTRPLSSAEVVEPPNGTETLLWSRTGAGDFPLAFAVNRPQGRIVCLAFDLEAEHLLGNDSIDLMLFFLNTLDWVSPQKQPVPAVVSTGGAHTVDGLPDRPLRVVDPHGVTVSLPAESRQVETDVAGVYQIHADGSSTTLIANLFDAGESDIGRAARDVPVPPPPRVLPAPPRDKSEIGWWFYVLAAALMASEWLAWRLSR